QCANLTTTNFQGADLTHADISGSRLLECNLYGAKITNTEFVNVMFDEISNRGHIKEQDKREKFYAHNNDVEFIKRMQDAWDKTDNEETPEGLDALHKDSILKQDSEDNWIIIPSKIRYLKKLYRELFTKIDFETDISESRIAYSINNATKYPGYAKNNYSKIEASLVKIWKELKAKRRNSNVSSK
ncbi:MAG: pentapeptide repeat-containing protein, partial [Gammaproteobacteria bacterium]|nr:pentapeptide repeat-containing protein [Gammaproteobacteria bacterium]